MPSEPSRRPHSLGGLAAHHCVAGAPRNPSWGSLRARQDPRPRKALGVVAGSVGCSGGVRAHLPYLPARHSRPPAACRTSLPPPRPFPSGWLHQPRLPRTACGSILPRLRAGASRSPESLPVASGLSPPSRQPPPRSRRAILWCRCSATGGCPTCSYRNVTRASRAPGGWASSAAASGPKSGSAGKATRTTAVKSACRKARCTGVGAGMNEGGGRGSSSCREELEIRVRIVVARAAGRAGAVEEALASEQMGWVSPGICTTRY